MITLEEKILKTPKKQIYAQYLKVCSNPKAYSKITRQEIYQELIALYKEDPEKILQLCSAEEVNILKSLLNQNLTKQNYGFIEYTILQNLLNNYLILENSQEYYIPSDFLNCIKMAINILDEEKFAIQDITDSISLGIIRIYNVLPFEEYKDLLLRYCFNIKPQNIKNYLKTSKRLQSLIKIVKYKQVEYVISLENNYYKEVLNSKIYTIKKQDYTLEEVISIGKYKLNLFKEPIFAFLSFLEIHLEPKYIEDILNSVILYCGLDINDRLVLSQIANDIPELTDAIQRATAYFPCWVYNGNDIDHLKENLPLPKKNEPCLCGSGKKFKHCCMKYYKM